MSDNEELIAVKKNYRQALVSQYKALYEQLAGNFNAGEKISIQTQIIQKENEIKQVNKEIDGLKQAGASDNKVYRAKFSQWKEHFPKINFSKSKGIINRVFNPFEEQRGVALFLLQKSRSMRGDLCIQHIKSVLQSLGTWRSPIEFEFLPHQPTIPSDFLNALASQFEIKSVAGNLAPAEVVEGICKSLQSGNVLLLQVEIYCVAPENNFLDWFIRQFWHQLLMQLEMLDHERPLIRVVAVISVKDIVPRECLSEELCCLEEPFDHRKLLELPLQEWTEIEICTWLFKFSNLSADGLGRADIEKMAKNIYRISEGRPSEVYSELMYVMTQKVS